MAKYIKVIDDFICKEWQDIICVDLDPERMSWALSKDATFREDYLKRENKQISYPSIGNLIYINGQINHNVYYVLYPMFLQALDKVGLNSAGLFRIRYGCYFNNNSGKSTVHHPHVDAETPHYTALYYPFDTDGDTYFYSDKSGSEIIAQITPKKGQMVIFDGEIYHSSSTPVNHVLRTTLNFNFLIKE